jgi:hypothetical protein
LLQVTEKCGFHPVNIEIPASIAAEKEIPAIGREFSECLLMLCVDFPAEIDRPAPGSILLPIADIDISAPKPIRFVIGREQEESFAWIYIGAYLNLVTVDAIPQIFGTCVSAVHPS